MRRGLAIGLAAGVAACGPPTPEQVAWQCADRAREAAGPTGGVAIGIGSGGGLSSRIDLGFSGDYLTGRDPQEVYETCLRRRLGPGAEAFL